MNILETIRFKLFYIWYKIKNFRKKQSTRRPDFIYEPDNDI